MTIITVYDRHNNQHAVIGKVISSAFTSSLSGECTFEFSVPAAMVPGIEVGMSVVLTDDDTEYYLNVVRVALSIDGLAVCTVTCEHKSYELNNEEYNITEYAFEGAPADCLAELLSDTNLNAGV